MNIKLAVTGLLGAVSILAVLYGWSSEPAMPAAAAPMPAASAQVLEEGRRIVALGDCMVCHTSATGRAYAGGLPLKTPFGTIYSTNITPDAETGIGRWTQAAFTRALRRGVASDGHLLYPAFPYTHYTRMSDRDIGLAYAYLMSRPAVRYTPPANELVFPLNFRPLLAFWNVLFLTPGNGAEAPAHGATIERGRYLVDTLGHCASCHSGLNVLGGERKPAFGGGEIDGWHAPALTRLTQGRNPWSTQQLADYLHGGLALGHGAAKGPMRPVAERLAEVPREDALAMASYLMSIQESAPPGSGKAPPATAPAGSAIAQGRIVFDAACASCHAAPAAMMRIGGRPALARSSALLSGTPVNFVQTVLAGIPWHGGSAVYMPPFAATLSDEQIASLAAYLRQDLDGQEAWHDVARQSAAIRKELQP
ncbi:c-type cytochrome [Massilia sp. METH4]|uniref:c-type cytochrome n=1 Tax=Massilia sp. METH4 TaxID=3123041 RepID=UPI0030D5B4DB